MTKQDITAIIKNNITSQLQKPESALSDIAKVYGDWLRGTVKRAQAKAVLSERSQQSDEGVQPQQTGGQSV